MAGFIAKQPNGRYCRFSYVVDCPTHINMTREDYMNNVTGTVIDREDGADTLDNYLREFSWVIDRFRDDNMTELEFDRLLEIMKTKQPTDWFSV